MQPIKKILCLSFCVVTISCSDDAPSEVAELPAIIEDTLLYSKNPNGHNELYRLQNGIESVVLSDERYDFWWPKVSPDRTRILVYRSAVNPDKNHDDYPNAELMSVDIDGGNPQVLIAKNANGWNAHGVCRWNKDGSKILMCAEVETESGLQWRLITTDNTGKNPKVLSDHWAIDCNFSADNGSVVFMGFKDNMLSFDLTELELQQGDYDAIGDTVANITALTQNNSRDHDPAFSPDGRKVVFSGGNAAYSDVDIILYDMQSNQESVLLNDANANGGSMCWSPNGKYIYFHSLEVFKSPFRIKRIHIDTKKVETILETVNNDFGFFHPEVY